MSINLKSNTEELNTEVDSEQPEIINQHGSGEDEDEEDDEEDDDEEDEHRVPIDLSQNEIYRGVCTLLEDEEGNNILEYISLLHTELIGINKSLENLKLIRKDITRLADCAEMIVKGKKSESQKDSSSGHTREQTREKTSASKKQ